MEGKSQGVGPHILGWGQASWGWGHILWGWGQSFGWRRERKVALLAGLLAAFHGLPLCFPPSLSHLAKQYL